MSKFGCVYVSLWLKKMLLQMNNLYEFLWAQKQYYIKENIPNLCKRSTRFLSLVFIMNNEWLYTLVNSTKSFNQPLLQVILKLLNYLLLQNTSQFLAIFKKSEHNDEEIFWSFSMRILLNASLKSHARVNTNFP